ncbi:MAG TPA: extracellular solute-binding protein [Acetobacteraceae bacterium]
MRRRLCLAAAMAVALSAGAARAADLTVWGLQAFNQAADAYIGEMVREFGKSRGINAEYVVVPANVINDRLAAAFQGGAPPDAFMQVSQRGQFYMANNLVAPLDDVLNEVRHQAGGIFENQLAVARAPDGTMQAIPLEVDVSPVFTRKDLLDQIGKPVPTTWEELREAAKLIQAKNPQIAGFGMTVSNANDAESQIRNVIWSFGGKVMAEDGRTVLFNSPETRAAYQFVADMFLKDRTIPRAALTWDDSGNNVAYQTGRAAFVINPPSVWYWMQDNDRTLLANTVMASVPRGPGPHGTVGNIVGSWVWQVSKASRQQALAKDWLRYFFEPARYRAVVEKVGGRWAPIYPAMLDQMPLFAGNPAFANFKTLAQEGFTDGYAGPPNALSGRVFDANILTKVLQRVLVDRASVEDAVAWGQGQIEALARN